MLETFLQRTPFVPKPEASPLNSVQVHKEWSMSRFVFSLLLTLAFLAGSTDKMFAQRSRKAAGASKEAPAAPAVGGLTVSVPEFGTLEASRGPASVTVAIKGGKAPYTATLSASVDPDSVGAKLEAVGDHADQYKLVVEPDKAGDITLKVKVSDSSEPKVEGESEITVHVVEKKTNLDDLDSRLESLETRADAIRALFAGPAGKEQVADLQKQVKDLSEQVSAVLSLLKYGAIGAFIIFVVFMGLSLIKSKGKGAAKGMASHAVALLLLFGAVADVRAAGPKVTCGDPEYRNNAVPDDGTEIAMVCRGVVGKTIEVVDSNIAVTDVKTVPGGFSFKIKASSGAKRDYPTVKIDGKEVEASLEIVSAGEWISRDRMAVTIKQMVGGNAGEEKLFRSYLLGQAQELGLDYNKLIQLLSSSKAGTSKEAIAAIEQAREKRVKGAVFEDTRYKLLEAKAEAAQKKVDALQAKVDGMSEGVSEDRVKEIVREEVKPVGEGLGKLAGETVKLAEAVAGIGNTTFVVEPGKKRLLGKDTPPKTALVNPDAATKAQEVQAEIQTWNLPVTKK
ncbi:MAG: hypothetical protein JNN11_01265 [Candidatus Doudnabacteria bacterium]|nr:hypothetical protein [Candidatus Doudnabacteria bacterium]